MLLKGQRGAPPRSLYPCHVCGEPLKHPAGGAVDICCRCLVERWEECRPRVEAVHAWSREIFGLPVAPPRTPDGIRCNICSHDCRMAPGESGYCGIRSGDPESLRCDGRSRGRAMSYFDPLPTNCVADWVCPGGTGAGYPLYSHDRNAEVGYYNLAVFFEACNLNCLYCQNWSFKTAHKSSPSWISVDELAGQVRDTTSCICYFGGDPIPQVPFALKVSRRVREMHPGRIMRICWETNGSARPAWLESMMRLSLESGGCIKMDLKAWSPKIHSALCGCDNRQVLENFSRLARHIPLRPDPPPLVASTLLVPGYVGEEEIFHLARFIAGLNPDIPYTLLAFTPQFCMDQFPTSTRVEAEACLEVARKAGLRRVRLGNRHFLG